MYYRFAKYKSKRLREAVGELSGIQPAPPIIQRASSIGTSVGTLTQYYIITDGYSHLQFRRVHSSKFDTTLRRTVKHGMPQLVPKQQHISPLLLCAVVFIMTHVGSDGEGSSIAADGDAPVSRQDSNSTANSSSSSSSKKAKGKGKAAATAATGAASSSKKASAAAATAAAAGAAGAASKQQKRKKKTAKKQQQQASWSQSSSSSGSDAAASSSKGERHFAHNTTAYVNSNSLNEGCSTLILGTAVGL
jgi:hypothetical protein